MSLWRGKTSLAIMTTIDMRLSSKARARRRHQALCADAPHAESRGGLGLGAESARTA